IETARQHPDWKTYASQLRYGHFEVSRDFFMYIFNAMKLE
ncbi:EVE domain-containing protein, partial [Streptococcus mutans]|nr:EVE domain-containing protein [Streptococcus mutans]